MRDHYARFCGSPGLRRPGRPDQGGGLDAAARARPLLTAREQQELMALIEAGPAAHGYVDQRWTLARIAELIRKRFGVRFRSSGALHEMLTRIGASWQVPARRAVERDEQAIAAWRTETWPVIKARP